jgi:energy-coupling factor transporter ATP-binding protein EcfA2
VSARLLDRLAAARRRAFVGRQAELELFRSVLQEGEAGAVLFVHGPGGIGKSTLLRHVCRLAEDARRRVVWLDGRELHTGSASALAALDEAVDGALCSIGAAPAPAGARDPLARLGEVEGAVLVLDNVELLAFMDGWLREELLPRLREDTVVALAGREQPVSFQADLGRRGVLRSVRLDNLDREHSAELLMLRGVPSALHAQAVALTQGHPLALALLADVYAQSGALPPATGNPQVFGVLLDGLIDSAPGPEHLAALEASSQVGVITEPLLAALLEVRDVRELFGWLRGLSIMDWGARGLFPHDVVRQRLATELLRRRPDGHAVIRSRAGAHYQRRLTDPNTDTDPATRRALLLEYAFLHRDDPVAGPLLRHVNPDTGSGTFSGTFSDGFTVSSVADGDWPVLAQIITGHEGAESAEHAHRWYRSQPGSVSVIRTPDGTVAGLVVACALDAATAAERDADPAATAAWRYLMQRRMSGDGALLVRHWMSAADHQAAGEVQAFISRHLVHLCLVTEGLGYVFVTCADPDTLNAAFRRRDFHRLRGADFEVGGRRYGMFGHDWRAVPPTTWITTMAGRATVGEQPRPWAVTEVTGLTQPEFADAVRSALRDLTRLDRLQGAALGRSRLVGALLTGTSTPIERAKRIREVIRAAAAMLEASPRDRKLFRVLHHTFLQPAENQVRAAALLDLPMSTYRRYLAAGVARLVEILWLQELDVSK